MSRNTKTIKSFTLSGGIDFSGGKTETGDNSLYYAENIIRENGKLRTRKGLIPANSTHIGHHDAMGRLLVPLTVTDMSYSFSNYILILIQLLVVLLRFFLNFSSYFLLFDYLII